jgi:hypothetical protein
MHPGGSS